MKKKPEKIRRIGLIANFEKPNGVAVLRRAVALIAKSGREVAMNADTAQMADFKCATFPDAAALARASDLILVFGGDGTMLRAVRESEGAQTPILGINVGLLGFLTAISSKDLPRALEQLWKNDFTVESRPLIQAAGQCGGTSIRFSALNDIVISHGAVPRLIELDVTVNDESVTRYRGDGLIISSPTGSTAYSLSAGGPIISPAADVFAITPICAHALANRSVIVSLNSTVRVQLADKQMDAVVAADGQHLSPLAVGETITICRSRCSANLIRLGGSSFFSTVRHKLHWSGSAVL